MRRRGNAYLNIHEYQVEELVLRHALFDHIIRLLAIFSHDDIVDVLKLEHAVNGISGDVTSAETRDLPKHNFLVDQVIFCNQNSKLRTWLLPSRCFLESSDLFFGILG